MRQILQNLSSGETETVEAPDPASKPGHVLIKTTISLISNGTERMLVDFGNSNLVQKALSQPERVKEVREKIITDGVVATYGSVKSKLRQPIPMGYCNVGRVISSDIYDMPIGERVVSNCPHATLVSASKNLCARIPDNVSDEAAAFTVLGSIGLQGIRLAKPSIGEAFAVFGAGLIGLLTIQMLRANGCTVLAIDIDPEKLKLAKTFGAETFLLEEKTHPFEMAMLFSKGKGVDGVIITASTKSSDLVSQAAQISRRRGRIILVGVTGLNLNRADFYEKELRFQVSCSYGPGRYDPIYENDGIDYPIGFVRWTEQRNFEAVLGMLSAGTLDVKKLITSKYDFDKSSEAYTRIREDPKVLGVLLDYGQYVSAPVLSKVCTEGKKVTPKRGPKLGFIGAGNYASRVLVPAFQKTDGIMHGMCSIGGLNATIGARRSGFSYATNDAKVLLDDPEIDAIVIATRHNSHAELVANALRSNKHVFVEKPLAITLSQLDEVKNAYANTTAKLMVGFNRRFSPQIVKIKTLLDNISTPKVFVMTMNAGFIPDDHWTQDSKSGGGRIIGEACHYIDLMRFLAGSPIKSIEAQSMQEVGKLKSNFDTAIILLSFEDGSTGSIHYLSNGNKSVPKERIEVYANGKNLVLNNFRRLKGYGWTTFKKLNLWKQDKGQENCVARFVDCIESGGSSPIPASELFEVAAATLKVDEILRGR